MIDLAELGGYAYHGGVMFLAYVDARFLMLACKTMAK
jgi:ATP phosphoribosyltransferase regulatory subunit HisZ